MNKTQEALKMAIEVLPELISQAQCEFDSQHKAYEGYPAMYYRYGYLKELADDGTKTLKACKEALAECEQAEPVGFIDEADDGIFGDVLNGIAEGRCNVGDYLYTTPQDQSAEIARLKAKVALDESLMAESTRTIEELEAYINLLLLALKGKQNES